MSREMSSKLANTEFIIFCLGKACWVVSHIQVGAMWAGQQHSMHYTYA